jgi:hypothetical protein
MLSIDYICYITDLPPGVFEHEIKRYSSEKWDGPVYSTMDTMTARLATYKNWPLNAVKTPRELAEGGFFFAGM